MSEVIFRHSSSREPLITELGFNGIAWAYVLNTAKFHTYGGEVIQILSCYIDSLKIEGEVKTYEEAEDIYEFFARYFVAATQGSDAEAGEGAVRFDQETMKLEYPEREWTFEIQPMTAPNFTYSNKTVAPKWGVQAHIVDRGISNEELQRYVGQFAEKELAKQGGDFKITGELSPISGDPKDNPFIAPLVPKVSDKPGEVAFEPIKASEIMAGVHREADFYHSLIPSYLKGDFTEVTLTAGSQPVFAQPGAPPQTESEIEQKSEKTITGKTR